MEYLKYVAVGETIQLHVRTNFRMNATRIDNRMAYCC